LSIGETQTAISASFGYFKFTEVATGETYIFTVRAKRYTFAQNSLIRNIFDSVADSQ